MAAVAFDLNMSTQNNGTLHSLLTLIGWHITSPDTSLGLGKPGNSVNVKSIFTRSLARKASNVSKFLGCMSGFWKNCSCLFIILLALIYK